MTEEQLLRQHPVLVVEDSMDDFEAMKRAFKKVGLINQLDHVTSGEDAMKYLKSNPRPSLVLLDLNMPGMGGQKALELIKSDETLKFIPVVVLTTSGYAPDVTKCYTLGANTYIRKPVDFDIFTKIIKNVKEYWLDLAMLPPMPEPRTA